MRGDLLGGEGIFLGGVIGWTSACGCGLCFARCYHPVSLLVLPSPAFAHSGCAFSCVALFVGGGFLPFVCCFFLVVFVARGCSRAILPRAEDFLYATPHGELPSNFPHECHGQVLTHLQEGFCLGPPHHVCCGPLGDLEEDRLRR